MPNVSDSEVNRFIEEAGPITMTASGNIEVSIEFLQSLVKKILELEEYVDEKMFIHTDRYDHSLNRNY